ncbi:MAG TPA: CHASE domain-containing protein [Methylomirabilota bacterium]|nr:CHASE domain-containing protein [Methylomirabilota bacterium]
MQSVSSEKTALTKPSARRTLPVWIATVAGVAFSIAAFYLARQQESVRAEAEFTRRADVHYAALQASLSRHLEILRSLQRLMQLSPIVHRNEFRGWARDIVAEQPEIQVLEWCPRVPKERRFIFENNVRRNGQPDFAIVEHDGNGQTQPAGDRDEYFPVLYFEPPRGNEILRGFDVSSGVEAAELARARDTGQPAASARVRMAQDIGDQFGLILTLPVYRLGPVPHTVEGRREAFVGCVRGSFRIRDLFTAAWRNMPVGGMDTLVLDSSASNPTNRFVLFDGAAGNVVTEASFRDGPHHEARLSVGGQTWTFLFRPVGQWWAAQFSWLPHWILAGGLVLTLLTAIHIRASLRRTEVIESTVAERTAELQQVNEQLRQTQTTLLQAQRIGRVGSWEEDLGTRKLFWSEETFRIFGQEPAIFAPTNEEFFASVHPDDRERVQKAVRAAIANGLRYDVEHRIRRPDGSECIVHEMAEVVRDEAGNPARLIGTVQDITERHYADERLEWERILLRTLIDNIPDYIFFKDHAGRFIMCNAAGQRLLGVPIGEDVAGKTEADFLPAEIAMVHAAADEKLLATGQPIVNREEPLVTRDGEKRFLLTTRIPLQDARGHVTGIVGVSRDITERKRTEDERQVMERKFQETQKLESLGVLAGGIAHDFNNLLTGILGNASLARMEVAPDSPLQPYFQQIELASQRAADLCKQMLAYSGKGRFVIQRINLTGLVHETLHLLRVSISKKAVLKLHLLESLPAVMADATQLRQIIMNLVMNASDAIGDRNGLITISTSTTHLDQESLEDFVGTAELPRGDYVVLEVTDNGCGMSPQTKAKVFEPFFTTKFTGRGLGLAAVLGIVRGHKGALKVHSEVGHGTTFRLLLPAAGAAACDVKVEPRPVPRWRGHGTVLVIDDEESVRMVAGKMLKTLGFDVLTAGNGEQGLNVYNARADISAVLLDLTMPEMDGEETFRELRQLRPDARVILMSGFNEQEAGARFVGKGLAGFLQKPFTPDELRDRLAAFGQSLNGN